MIPLALAFATPAGAQGMDGMAMPADRACPLEHAAMGHCTPAVPPAGAPPPPPTDRAADAYYPPAAMARADKAMRREHGGMAFSQILFNLAEYQLRRGQDGYRWDGEGWFGGDIHRLVVKTEGEGRRRGGVDDAEVQALYSRAIDPYFNLQAGLRQDLGQGAKRSYATIGVEGLAPYWFQVEGALFLSNRGDLLGRIEATYDQRITQRLLLQPRVELNLAAQTVRASGIGAGLSQTELGLRLRYEITRRFAPYVGVSWERRTGAGARLARDHAATRAVTLGLRSWF